jgi:D-alanine--poly(phosphoribitol) ligase subunit 1
LIVGHKEADCVAAMIACAMTSRPFVFADRSYPVPRIKRIATVASVTGVLAAGPVPDDLKLPVIDVAKVPGASLQAGNAVAAEEDAIFYIIFTSGSSGEPKGVPIARSNYTALHGWYTPMVATVSVGAHVNHSTFAFDMGMFDLWPALALSRPVIMLDHQNNIIPRNNIRHLLSCTEAQPTSWASTPSLLQLMCTDPLFSEETFSRLSWFVVGGEMLPRPLIRELMRRFPKAKIFNGYGPSEATCATHLYLLGEADAQGEGPVCVGPAIAPSAMSIVDPEGNPLPAGEAGEVELSGPQVIRHYLPADHPANRAFGWRDGRRTYRTGDLGRIDDKGSLTLLGRIDRQVKWLGNRIELDEIERVADGFPSVHKSVCLTQSEGGRVTGIVLFVQAKSGAQLRHSELLAHLGRFLPATMVPRDVRFVDHLPVTLNGKIDAKVLLDGLAIS